MVEAANSEEGGHAEGLASRFAQSRDTDSDARPDMRMDLNEINASPQIGDTPEASTADRVLNQGTDGGTPITAITVTAESEMPMFQVGLQDGLGLHTLTSEDNTVESLLPDLGDKWTGRALQLMGDGGNNYHLTAYTNAEQTTPAVEAMYSITALPAVDDFTASPESAELTFMFTPQGASGAFEVTVAARNWLQPLLPGTDADDGLDVTFSWDHDGDTDTHPLMTGKLQCVEGLVRR